jgi:phospholipase A1
MNITIKRAVLAVGVGFISNALASAEQDQCLLEQLNTAEAGVTLQEVRDACKIDQPQAENVAAETALEERWASEDRTEANRFELTAYRPNYLLFATYNSSTNEEHWTDIFPDANMDHAEAKFQISFKTRLAKGILGGELWGAYSQQSWWQVYNSDESAPFRETNYEPEIFLRWDTDFRLLGFDNNLWSFGFNHESNGRGELTSRSWNRLVAATELHRGRLVFIGRAWHRIAEDDEDDDNPDLLKYTGYGDLKVLYKWNRHLLASTLTNNLRSDNKGAVQLDWTFPLTQRFKGYVQYYNGYGESLIDYNHSTNRIGIGVLLNDWL